VNIANQVLSFNVTGSSGIGEVYIDNTNWVAPQSSSGFDTLSYDATLHLITGDYSVNGVVPLSLKFYEGGAGGGTVDHGGTGTSTGGSLGGVASVRLGALDATAKQANPIDAELPVTWYGVPDVLCVSLDFGDYVKWITVSADFPARLEGHQSGSIHIEITPPADAKEGRYTIPVEGVFSASGYTNMKSNNYIYLTVEKGVAPYVDPTASSPMPNFIGILLGSAILIALFIAFRRR
jgi:hypothetical protein